MNENYSKNEVLRTIFCEKIFVNKCKRKKKIKYYIIIYNPFVIEYFMKVGED